jgi:hypothetical protein
MAASHYRELRPIGGGEVGIGLGGEVKKVEAYIKDRLTPKVDEMQVDDELDDLHSSQILLPLEECR